MLGLLPILLIFGIFYFLLFLPMQRQRKQTAENAGRPAKRRYSGDQRRDRRNHCRHRGDDTLVLRVKPDNVKLQVTRGSVSSLVSGEGKK